MEPQKNRLVLIDGNNLAYRADAVLNLSVGTQRVSAIYGTLVALRHVLTTFDPTQLVVVWDAGRYPKRTELYPAYKAHRDEADEIKKLQRAALFEQIDILKTILRTMGVQQLEIHKHEADDIIAVLALGSTCPSIIVSNDRDFIQLVSERISLYLPTDKVMIDRDALMSDPSAVKKEYYGLTPKQVLIKKMLMGDKSDNISGIPGVGERTAYKLARLGSTCRVSDLLAELSGAKDNGEPFDGRMLKVFEPGVRAILIRNRYLMDLRYWLVPVSSEVVPEYRRLQTASTFDADLVRKVFVKYKFASMLKNFESFLDPFRKVRR